MALATLAAGFATGPTTGVVGSTGQPTGVHLGWSVFVLVRLPATLLLLFFTR